MPKQSDTIPARRQDSRTGQVEYSAAHRAPRVRIDRGESRYHASCPGPIRRTRLLGVTRSTPISLAPRSHEKSHCVITYPPRSSLVMTGACGG
jgi:hypothetical protein